jgi:two-component system chemotaxis response regulator CheY
MAHVLVADDDGEIRASLCLVLEDAGHTVIEAADGATALAILESSPRALVALLDYRMPEINGTGVLAALADADGRLPARHAVLLFTAANAATLDSTTQALFPGQVVRVIAKPFDVDEILGAVAEAQRTLDVQPR